MILSHICAALFSITYGMIEALIIDMGFDPGDWNSLFGKFSKRYHIPMGTLFLIVAVGLGVPEDLPGMILIEDRSYFAFSQKDKLTEKSWVTGSWGGGYILGQYIPKVYLALALLQACLINFLYWRAI